MLAFSLLRFAVYWDVGRSITPLCRMPQKVFVFHSSINSCRDCFARQAIDSALFSPSAWLSFLETKFLLMFLCPTLRFWMEKCPSICNRVAYADRSKVWSARTVSWVSIWANIDLTCFCLCRISHFGGVQMVFVYSMRRHGPAQQLYNTVI